MKIMSSIQANYEQSALQKKPTANAENKATPQSQSPTGEQLTLTETAAKLQRLSNQISSQPEVDQ